MVALLVMNITQRILIFRPRWLVLRFDLLNLRQSFNHFGIFKFFLFIVSVLSLKFKRRFIFCVIYHGLIIIWWLFSECQLVYTYVDSFIFRRAFVDSFYAYRRRDMKHWTVFGLLLDRNRWRFAFSDSRHHRCQIKVVGHHRWDT